MALTGTLVADFGSFQTAVENAVIQLRGFEASTNKVESSLTRMTDNFSGRKIITEATLMSQAVENVGGVSKLTQSELDKVGRIAAEAADKMKAWGQDVPPKIQALADTVKTAGGHLEGMLGIATQIAGAFGVAFSIGAVVNFGKELFRAADELTKLHDKTGVSIEGLQRFQVAGDDAGNTVEDITNAIVKMEDKLVGGDASAAGALEKLHLSFDDLKSLSPEQQFIAISDAIRKINDPAEQVNIAIDLFGKQGANVLPTLKRGFDDLKDSVVGMGRETVRTLDETGDALAKYWRTAKGFAGEALAGAIRGITDPGQFGAMAHALDDATAAAERAAPKFKGLAVPGLPENLKDIEAGFKADEEAINHFMRTLEKLDNDALKKSTQAHIDWQNSIQKTIDAGVKLRVDSIIGGSAQIEKAEATLADFIHKTTLDSTSYQILKAWETADEQEKAFKGSEQQRATFNAAVEALATEQAQAIRNTADAAAAATEAAAAREMNAILAVTKSYYAQIDAMAIAAGMAVTGNRPGEGNSGVNQGSMERGPGVNQGFTVPINNWSSPYAAPGRAGGGSVMGGSSYLVGERGPELFTPRGSGFITPNGGGVSVTNHIYVNGTAADVARQVAAEILRTVQQSALLS